MGSKREEEKNEKIIRGLMKLPPNRRCINCNSLGPQYVCTNFWTFVCMTCSGIHREFTHRVKSVSMAKFTSQEVDALQKGGNQRAREFFLKGWDPHRQRLPDNSNVDKVREFIKNVYVEKRYAIEKSSDKPPRDPQSTRSHEEEKRRASSYHSYSQSPPYDFQYEERHYGRHAASLTRTSGSDHIIFEGKFSSFLSPSRPSDHVNDERFANERSYPRVLDYSFSSGSDPFGSDMLSSSSQRDIGSPFSETSSYFSSEQSGHPTVLPNSDANSRSSEGRIRHPQRTESSGSFGSFDSMSFKSVNSVGLQEVVSEPEQSLNMSHGKTSSVPSPHSSMFTAFNGVDLFSEPFVPQNVTSTPTAVCNPQLSLAQSVDLFQQSPISSVPKFSEQQSVASSNSHTSGAVTPNNRGWATFDVPRNVLPGGTEDSMASVAPSSDGNNSGNFNSFSLDQTSSSQNFTSCEPIASTHTLWHDGLQKVEPIANSTQFWNAFEDSLGQHPTQNMLKNSGQDALFCASDANKSLGFGIYQVLNSDENVKLSYNVEPCSSSLSSQFNMAFHDFSMVPAVDGVHSFETERKPANPFDLPCDADWESSNAAQFWDMSSLQAALPNNQMPASYADASQSWFPQDSVPSYVPGVTFGPSGADTLGFQMPSTQISGVHAQGPVSSIGGNPFA